MANLRLIANGVSLYPAFPIEREVVPVSEERRFRSGQMRRALIATKMRFRYTLPGATEAERTSWLSAHPWNTSYAFTDEQGVARTVVTMAFADPLSSTEPLVPGGLATTGAAYYDLAVEVEEV